MAEQTCKVKHCALRCHGYAPSLYLCCRCIGTGHERTCITVVLLPPSPSPLPVPMQGRSNVIVHHIKPILLKELPLTVVTLMHL